MNVDFPFGFDGRGRTAEAGTDDHVRDMIEQVLFTTPGERVNRPTFGCGLLQLVFAPNSDLLAAATHMTVQAALQQFLGDVIEVKGLEIANEDAILRLLLTYVIRRSGVERTDLFTSGTPA